MYKEMSVGLRNRPVRLIFHEDNVGREQEDGGKADDVFIHIIIVLFLILLIRISVYGKHHISVEQRVLKWSKIHVYNRG